MKVVITTGGSGGHIYPALSIMKRLEKEGHEIIFVGRNVGMEKDIIPKRYKYIGVDVTGMKGVSCKTIKALLNFHFESKRMVKCFTEIKPDCVIGFGSYVSAPAMKAALKLKIKTVIHEQNSVMGKTNRMISKKVNKVLLGMDGEKGIIVGNPRSQEILENYKKELHIGRNIVIFAGSQGSEVINDFVVENQREMQSIKGIIHFVTGKKHYEKIISKIDVSKNIKVYDYIENMNKFLSDKDLCIVRAGASTISELTAIEMPMILIPSPYVTNDHQHHNALLVEEKGAAILVREKDLNKLIEKVKKITDNDLKKMMSESTSLCRINSIDLFVTQIKELMGE